MRASSSSTRGKCTGHKRVVPGSARATREPGGSSIRWHREFDGFRTRKHGPDRRIFAKSAGWQPQRIGLVLVSSRGNPRHLADPPPQPNNWDRESRTAHDSRNTTRGATTSKSRRMTPGSMSPSGGIRAGREPPFSAGLLFPPAAARSEELSGPQWFVIFGVGVLCWSRP